MNTVNTAKNPDEVTITTAPAPVQHITISTLGLTVRDDAEAAGITLTPAEQKLLKRMISGEYIPAGAEVAVFEALDAGDIRRVESRLPHTLAVMTTCGLVAGGRINPRIAAELGYTTDAEIDALAKAA